MLTVENYAFSRQDNNRSGTRSESDISGNARFDVKTASKRGDVRGPLSFGWTVRLRRLRTNRMTLTLWYDVPSKLWIFIDEPDVETLHSPSICSRLPIAKRLRSKS